MVVIANRRNLPSELLRGLENRGARGHRDGVAVDSEAALWVARWQAGEIVRYRADGTVDRRLRLPYPYVVSLTFGGADLCDLIVTTGGDPGQTRHGAVLRVRCDVPGVAAQKAKLQ